MASLTEEAKESLDKEEEAGTEGTLAEATLASFKKIPGNENNHDHRSIATTVDTEGDEALARALQVSEHSHPAYRIEEAELFSQRLHSLYQDLVKQYGVSNPSYKHIKPVLPTFAIRRLYQAQEAFHEAGKDYDANLGFHFTTQTAMQSINQYGLLTRKERGNMLGFQPKTDKTKGSKKQFHNGRIRFGDGIYTLHAIFNHQELRDADTGLMVARLYGKCTKNFETRRSERLRQSGGPTSRFDTQLCGRCAVLQRSSQTLPLMEYPLSLAAAGNHDGQRALQIVQRHVQELVSESFNSRALLEKRGILEPRVRR